MSDTKSQGFNSSRGPRGENQKEAGRRVGNGRVDNSWEFYEFRGSQNRPNCGHSDCKRERSENWGGFSGWTGRNWGDQTQKGMTLRSNFKHSALRHHVQHSSRLHRVIPPPLPPLLNNVSRTPWYHPNSDPSCQFVNSQSQPIVAHNPTPIPSQSHCFTMRGVE